MLAKLEKMFTKGKGKPSGRKTHLAGEGRL